jgi:hypothetical protein
MSTNTTLAAQPAQESRLATPRPSAAFGARGIEIRQYDELARFAQTVSNSGLAPKGMERAESIFVAVQMGLEVGLSPMAALQNIAVVNGRPTIWGDAQLAVCRGTGELETFDEWFEVNGAKTTRNPSEYKDDTAAVCKVKRKGGSEVESAFSVADAKRAGLWGKTGPWTQYPFRMLRNRARSFALRDTFGDALKGFRSTEEVLDDTERDVTPPPSAASKLFTDQPAPLPAPQDKPVVERARARGVGGKTATPAAPAGIESAPDAAPNDLLDVPAQSLPEQIKAKCAADGVTWPVVAAALADNGLAEMVFGNPEEAPEAVLSETLAIWPQVVLAVRAAKKGGA